jgi:hypothetical protein
MNGRATRFRSMRWSEWCFEVLIFQNELTFNNGSLFPRNWVLVQQLLGDEALSRSSLKEMRMFPIKHFTNYLIFYRPLAGKKIEVVRIAHGARDLPTLFGTLLKEKEDGEDRKAA